MRDWLFRLLFPRQYEQIKHLSTFLKVSSNPNFQLNAPDGVCFKDIYVCLEGHTINAEWVEIPVKEKDEDSTK